MSEREDTAPVAPVVRRWGLAYALVLLVNLLVVAGVWLAFRPYR